MSVLFIKHPTTHLIILLSTLVLGCSQVSPPETGQATASVQQETGQEVQQESKPALAGLPLACTDKVLVPALFRETRRRILVFEGSPEYSNTPAEIAWETKRIQVEPARFPVETVPAQYREIMQSIPVLRERVEVVGEEAVYKTVQRPVVAQPAYTRWKAGCNGTAETCLESVPEKVRKISQQIIEMPPRMVQKRIPAEIIRVKRKILVKPGQGSGKPLPARYRDIRVGRVSKTWRIKTRPRRTRYEEVPIREKIRPEQVRELAVVCTEQMSSAQMRLLQQRLQAEGYTVAISGRMDASTRSALLRFQQENDLMVGALTLETLRKLGLA